MKEYKRTRAAALADEKRVNIPTKARVRVYEAIYQIAVEDGCSFSHAAERLLESSPRIRRKLRERLERQEAAA